MKWLWFTGIWLYFPLVAIMHLAIEGLGDIIDVHWLVQVLMVYGFPLLLPITITWTNIERKQHGQTDFSFAAVYGGLSDKDERHSKDYLDAAYPEIPREQAATRIVAYCGAEPFCEGGQIPIDQEQSWYEVHGFVHDHNVMGVTPCMIKDII